MDCQMSAWSEWADCSAATPSAFSSGTEVKRRTREVLERSTNECPCTVEFTVCGTPGRFQDLLYDIRARHSMEPAPYSPAPPAAPEPTLRPLTEEEIENSLERLEELEGCIVTEWSEWSSCRHRRWTYKLKAAMQTRYREVAKIDTNKTCPHGEETRTCMDNGPITKVVYDFS